jgi:hypothetical protein
MEARYGFEAQVDGQWSRDAAGQQDGSNTFDTREEAKAEIPRLARVLGCDEGDLRVVAVAPVGRAPELIEALGFAVGDDGTDNLRVIVETALSDDRDVTLEELVEIVTEARADAAAETRAAGAVAGGSDDGPADAALKKYEISEEGVVFATVEAESPEEALSLAEERFPRRACDYDGYIGPVIWRAWEVGAPVVPGETTATLEVEVSA